MYDVLGGMRLNQLVLQEELVELLYCVIKFYQQNPLRIQ